VTCGELGAPASNARANLYENSIVRDDISFGGAYGFIQQNIAPSPELNALTVVDV
jgi:hypothetical protein